MVRAHYAALLGDRVYFRASTRDDYRVMLVRPGGGWGLSSIARLGAIPCHRITVEDYATLLRLKKARVAVIRASVVDEVGGAFMAAPDHSWVKADDVPPELWARLH